MKKFVLSLAVIISFTAYILHKRFETDDRVKVLPPNILSRPTADITPFTNNSSKRYKDGSYTGAVTDAYYGDVQVRVIITNSQITDVIFLDYPQDQDTSRAISQQAMPYLKTEAIQAQSADVDIVSGATQTSEAFIKSLQTALDQAI